jgi:phosphohistidine phosphatase
MKKVILTRHAKPLYIPGVTDFDLELSDQGRLEEFQMIESLRLEGHIPTVVYHSPLKRTKETAKLIAEAFCCPLFEEEALHEFDFDRLQRVIDRRSHGECLVFVGHAPSLREFFCRLTGEKGVSFGMSSYKVVNIIK